MKKDKHNKMQYAQSEHVESNVFGAYETNKWSLTAIIFRAGDSR